MEAKLMTREELMEEHNNQVNLKLDEACKIVKKENPKLYDALKATRHFELKELLKQGKKPSKQMMEVFFCWLSWDQGNLVNKENAESLKLLIKYGAYKLTLWELIKYGA